MDNLNRSRKGNRIRGTFGLLWKVSVPAVLFGFAISFLDKAGAGIFSFADSAWDFLFLALLALILFGFYLYFIFDRLQRQINATATSFDAQEITDRPYMICGYSPIKGANQQVLALDLNEFGSNVDKACDPARFNELQSWQQNLRVLCAIRCVKHLYVIDPDTDQFDRFQEVITHFFPDIQITRVTGKDGNTTLKRHHHDKIAPDYENFEYVSLAIERALHMIAEHEKKNQADGTVTVTQIENKTAIDVTGGLKTFSIAAAIMSLNRDLVFVYAVTIPERLGKVIAYDAKIQLFEEGF